MAGAPFALDHGQTACVEFLLPGNSTVRRNMSLSLRRSVVVCLFALLSVAALQVASAQDDVVHEIRGLVKHVDRGAKTIVVKAEDGTEHSVKWTEKTSWDATKDAGMGIKDGSKVSVKYTEKAGEKTAVGVKDIGKDAAKAVQ
jgi:Cu/Ag efflux protein CusF